MSGGRYTKSIPEHVYFIGEGEWVQGPYVNRPRHQGNVRKFALTEVENEVPEKKPHKKDGKVSGHNGEQQGHS